MKTLLNETLKTIQNPKIQEFAINCLNEAPDYFFQVPASSSGKYHPQTSLGEGGLVRHSVTVVYFLNWLMEPEMCTFNNDEKDLLRVAAAFHDVMKSGTQEDYEKNKHTKFNHPLLAADFIRNCATKYNFSEVDANFIASCIESHMGQWNTDSRSDSVLPKPVDKYQKMLHLADYLASRKPVNIDFGIDVPKPVMVDETKNANIITFGKYEGKDINELIKTDRQYLEWCVEKMSENRPELVEAIKKIL